MPINVSGRFKVLDQPSSLPSKCAFCSLGHNQNGKVKFIDTTLDLDFYGVVYICSTCLTEIADSLGYIHPDAWTSIVENSNNLIDVNGRLRGENDGLRSALSTLTGHRCHVGPVARETSEDSKQEEVNEGSTSGSVDGVEQVESESSEPDSKSGLSDVRGAAKPKPSKPSVKPSDDPLAEYDV